MTIDRRLRTDPLERYLVDLGVAYTRNEQLPLDEIDGIKSLTNQARVRPLDQPTVERYALDLDAGDTFPPIIVWRRSPTSKLMLLGGNHRYAAHRRLERPTIDAYIVECDELTATRITYEDNRNHGLSLTQDERIAHATHLIDLGVKVAKAARIAGLSNNMISRAIAVTRTDRRALELGLNVQDFTKIPKTGRSRLGDIKPDNVFAEAAKVCIAAHATPDEIYTLVTTINAAATINTALAVIDERRNRWAHRSGRGRKAKGAPNYKLADACFTVTTLPVNDIVRSCATNDERAALARRCSETVVHLSKVIANLGVRKLK